jgi:hypothetical protein
MASSVGVDVGKGRHRRRRQNKENDKKALLRQIKEENQEERRENRQRQRAEARENKRNRKWNHHMSEHTWRDERPSFTTLAISFNLLTNPGAKEALDKLREAYDRGKLSNLLFIAESQISSDEIDAARKWLKSIGHEWAYGHTVFNTSRGDKPEDFIYRVLKTHDVDSLVFGKVGRDANWIRNVIKTLRMHEFKSWDSSMEWINRLNSKYFSPASPGAEAVEVIDTRKGQPRMLPVQRSWADD